MKFLFSLEMTRNTLISLRYCMGAMALLLTTTCGSPPAGCPDCSDDLQLTSILPDDFPFRTLEVKWNALNGTPAIDDPSLLCEDNFEEVLLNRHLRAGLGNWTQCKILLGTVFGSTANYGLFDDPDLSVGAPGDIVRTRYADLFFPVDGTQSRLASLVDEGSERFAATDKSVDLYKTMVFNQLSEEGQLKVLIGTNGLFNERMNEYWVLPDVDNNENTGLDSRQIVEGSDQEGVDMAVKVEVSENGTRSNTTLYKAEEREFQQQPTSRELLKTELFTSEVYISSPEECTSSPVFQEIELNFSREALVRYSHAGEVDLSFSNGLKLQAISVGTAADGGKVMDKCPERPMAVLR
ncbi:hypothetical protein [Cyclobacterium salsum]|uniref:hypothetical protein n=1 Tax=Cyclobacterium salsum TaxID=2666329 RepID=UPI00139119F7|nr:hypothetical protein [Cyclobacterium salsum]